MSREKVLDCTTCNVQMYYNIYWLAGLIDTGPAFKGAIVSQFRVTVTKTHHRDPAAIIALSFVNWFESVLTSRRRLFIAIGGFALFGTTTKNKNKFESISFFKQKLTSNNQKKSQNVSVYVWLSNKMLLGNGFHLILCRCDFVRWTYIGETITPLY